MKRENKLRKAISKTTFQTQLFLIVLLCFVLFIVIEYFLIQYTFRTRYVKRELDSVCEKIDKLSKDINESQDALIILLSDFYEENDAIPLYISSQTGSYTLVESSSPEYTIKVTDGTNDYDISIFTYDAMFNIGEKITLYVDASSSGNGYIAKKIIFERDKVESFDK